MSSETRIEYLKLTGLLAFVVLALAAASFV
jgi:hypothetical protein